MKRVLLGAGAALALLAAAPAARAQSVEWVTGRWEGGYSCSQGDTWLRLTLTGTGGNQVNGEFFFDSAVRADRSTNFVPQGAFQVAGTYDPYSKTLSLHGGKWTQYPNQGQWAMVDLTGTVDWSRNGYSGRVSGAPSCTAFAVLKK